MLQRLLSGCLQVWEWDTAGRRRHLPFLVPAAIVIAAAVYVGAVRTHACGHDVMHFLDGAWRVLSGQRPHLDFYSPLGPLTYLVTAAGLLLSGLRVEGIGYGISLAGAVLGAWGYGFALRQMRLVPAALTGCFVTLLAVAPVPLGAGPNSLSHAMFYNRLGFALLALVLLEVLEEPPRTRRGAWLPGFSTGVAVSLLLLLKASYFLVGVVLILAFATIRKRTLAGWLGIAAGIALVLMPVLVWLRFDAAAFLSDQLMTGAARGQQFQFQTVAILAYRSISDLVLMLLVAFLAAGTKAGSGLPQWRWPLAATATFAAGILLMATNAQDAGLPLSVVLILLVAGSEREPQPAKPAAAACALAAVLLLFSHASLDVVSLASAAWQRHSPPPGAAALTPAHMGGLLLYDLGGPRHPMAYSNGSRYADYINRGLRLLEAQTSPEESVAILEQCNPFSYALLRRPPAGGFTFLGYQYSFSDRSKPTMERLFGGTDIVMVPKRNFTDPAQYDAILAAYLPGIKDRFTLAAETPEWWMYRRGR